MKSKLLVTEDSEKHWNPSAFAPMSAEELGRILASFRSPVTFDDLVMLARRYQAAVYNDERLRDPKAAMLSEEMALRLEQINILIKSIYALLFEYRKLISTDDRKVLADYYGDRGSQMNFLMFLHAESFYYFAHRVQEILGSKRHRLPGVKGFKSAGKITYLRNHLIEHVFGTYETGGFHGGMHGENGPMIILRGGEGEPWERIKHLKDPGVLVNAASFRDAVVPVLAAALASIPEDPDATEMAAKRAVRRTAREKGPQ